MSYYNTKGMLLLKYKKCLHVSPKYTWKTKKNIYMVGSPKYAKCVRFCENMTYLHGI